MRITTDPNAITPGPAVTSAYDWKRTSATVNVTTNTSSIDQRPMRSMSRYSTVRSCGRHLERRYAVISSSTSTSTDIFSIGTRMLAPNTITASGHSPDVQK